MSKGEETRSSVLGSALSLATQVGLEGLTIGKLAEHVGMSKSGLFAHFSSKENLQVAILDEAAARFVALVVDAVTEVFGTGGEEMRPAPALGAGDDLRGIEGVASYGGGLVFVLDVRAFSAIADAVASVTDPASVPDRRFGSP